MEAIVEQNGRIPDNFVEPYDRAGTGPASSDGSFCLPDTPQTRSLLERVDAAVDELRALEHSD